MKTLHAIVFIGASLFATAAFAGVHVENVTRDIATKAQQGNTQVMLVQDGKMRVNAQKDGATILKGSTIVIIDDKHRTYREMTKEDLKKMVAGASEMMAKMQERLKNMSPEQRAQMEKMMGNRIPGGLGTDKPDTWESKNLGTTDTVEGRKCQNWSLIRNGAPFEELCVVPYGSLPGKEDFQKVFQEMADAFGDLAKQVPGAEQSVKARTAINGYPVRTRQYGPDGKFRSTETIMTKWVEESIPAATFDPPPGYAKAELPKRP
ncbi:MAG TPA: hypothetical protein VMF52_17620 [Steroidobacteraceae bacterium]|nr:hypothetical protein [Steroidobacteraceae bacterium]